MSLKDLFICSGQSRSTFGYASIITDYKTNQSISHLKALMKYKEEIKQYISLTKLLFLTTYMGLIQENNHSKLNQLAVILHIDAGRESVECWQRY